MKKVFGCLLVLLGVFLFSSSAVQSAEKDDVLRMDVNGDGRVDEQELREEIKRIAFASMDQDGDGFVSKEEWLAADQEKTALERFDSIDTNKDGRIDQLEFADFVKEDMTRRKLFENLDADGSGYLTHDEWAREPSFALFGIRF